MDYKTYFERTRKEEYGYNNITIIFFKTFSKIVLLPESLEQYLSWNIELKEDSLTYQGIAYGFHKKYPLREDCPTKELDVKFTVTINYSDILGFVCYKSDILASSTILTAKDFGKASDGIQEEIETICERLVK